jgi:hypothetical protein
MISKIYTYSLIKSLYEKGKDYIDSFWPLMLSVMEEGKSITLDNIKVEVYNKYEFDIPIHSLRTIAVRAKKRGHLRQSHHTYTLTPKGVNYKQKLDDINIVETRTNKLIGKAYDYLCTKQSLLISQEEIKSLFLTFIKEHIQYFEQYLSGGDYPNGPQRELDLLQEHEVALIEFIIEIEKSDEESFRAFQDIICGSIISVIVNSASIQDTDKGFESMSVFFDTNILFAILELDHDEFNRAAQELFRLMLQEGSFKFFVFDFTVNEFIRLLSSYGMKRRYYPGNIRINTIFSNLRIKGWTVADVRQFIANIDDKLHAKKIDIYPTALNTETYEPKPPEVRQTLAKYKSHQNNTTQNHDLAALELINKIRSKPLRRIEEAKALFLTSDIKLARFNYLEMKHNEFGTIPETIIDRVLTNILWLKKPNKGAKFSIDTLIAFHSKGLFLDKDVWIKFLQFVSELRKKGKIDEKDMTILLYDRQLTRTLRIKGQNIIPSMNEDWVFDRLEEAKKRMDATRDKEISQLIEQHKTELSDTEGAGENKLLTYKIELRTKATQNAEKDTQKLCLCIMSMVSIIILFGGSYLMRLLIQNWSKIEPVSWGISFIVSALLLAYYVVYGKKEKSFFHNNSIRQAIFNWRLRKRLDSIKTTEDKAKV